MSNLNTGSGPGPAPSDLPKPPSRHQVKRSLTEFASPARPQRHHHHHLPLHHFHHHHHRHLQHLRQHDGREAPLQLRHSLDMIRSTGPASATLSPGQSRRASLSAPRDDGRDMDEAREARLRREQAKASIRADILKQSLVDLNAFSTTMTRQLDETYYAVLEKMSRLQSTVTAIQGLAESLRETR
ncbi:hypothetical protein CDD83_3008 [Cordyceps sp. RAO-2017]|nr:hypothetical protein CDD83_3008 [Cordyceps sp. RAO-2017]